MLHVETTPSHSLPTTASSHPENPVPEEPQYSAEDDSAPREIAPSSVSTASLHSFDSTFESDIVPGTPTTPPQLSSEEESDHSLEGDATPRQRRRASTKLIASGPADVRRIIGQDGTQYIGKICCGGGCCWMNEIPPASATSAPLLTPPDNEVYQSLGIKTNQLTLESTLSGTAELPEQTVSFANVESDNTKTQSRTQPTLETHAPDYVTPHPPYSVYSSQLFHARELTKPGAEKRTYHFDLDVTDYPEEIEGVDFRVGGAIGVCAPNDTTLVDEIFDTLGVPTFVRDRRVLMQTSTGRWPTIWGEDQPRSIETTRRELLTWCSDVQSYAPTKQILRVLAEHAHDATEQKILMYLASAQGQAAFCDLRTGPHVTLIQMLRAFPSARPPLELLLSVLPTLMPRFYSLSQDPHVSCERKDTACRRLIEIAVSVHESPEGWRQPGGQRTGVGSGFLERQARRMMEAEKNGIDPSTLNLRVPMFRGLMANPLAKQFASDGPMLLIGAGVGIAPFRGFVQRRLKSANCANKVWVLQGVRDSLLDELYSGEWGVEDDKVKTVVQSRQGRGKYVQEEVRYQADLVWFIINSIDGRIFVCGSSKGMGEGVDLALVDVAMEKGGMNKEEALSFWEQKKQEGQYIAVSEARLTKETCR